MCYLCQFFNNALVVGRSAESEVADHLYDLILELHAIDSSILLSVMPQLEFKLKVRKHFSLGYIVCERVDRGEGEGEGKGEGEGEGEGEGGLWSTI